MVNHIGTMGDNVTQGEKTFKSLVTLAFRKDENIYCYYEPVLRNYRPDFVVLGPKFGALIVEIKDYLPESIGVVSKTEKWIHSNPNEEPLRNPFNQLYNYWRNFKQKVEHEKTLQKLKVEIKKIAVFSNIESESEAGKLIRSMKPDMIDVCFADDLVNIDTFRRFLAPITSTAYNLPLSKFKILRALICPICRVPTLKQESLLDWLDDPNKIKLLDLEQEKQAHELGAGHRIFYGVAGSGKTVLLVARVKYLAKTYPKWRILVLCYNRMLKNFLTSLIVPQDFQNVEVNTFHSWAREVIKNCGSEFSLKYDEYDAEAKRLNQLTEFFSKIVPKLLEEVHIFSPMKYDAILIDEGQDFEAEWFTSTVNFLNKETNSLLIALDGLQGIYSRKKIRWIDCGINAQGRVKKFKKSYRTPKTIGELAHKVLPQSLITLMNTEAEEFLTTEEFLGIQGNVNIIIAKNKIDEYNKLTQILPSYQKRGDRILILFRRNHEKTGYDHMFFRNLESKEIKWESITQWNRNFDAIFIGTLHSSKGLEAETIIIPEIDTFTTVKDRQLLYVGFTRTLKNLLLTASKETDLVKMITDGL